MDCEVRPEGGRAGSGLTWTFSYLLWLSMLTYRVLTEGAGLSGSSWGWVGGVAAVCVSSRPLAVSCRSGVPGFRFIGLAPRFGCLVEGGAKGE